MKDWKDDILPALFALMAWVACNRPAVEIQDSEGFSLVGAWELIRIEYPDGRTDTLDVGNYTRCKIYDADSTYYSIELISDGDEVYIIPHEMARYSLSGTTYVENNRPTPFQIRDDSTMTTVWAGYTEVMRKASSMTEARKKEIRDIVRRYFSAIETNKNTRLTNFVLSTSERELRNKNEYFLLTIVLLVLVVAMLMWYFWQTLKRKREIEKQLHELQQIRDLRPAPVTNAMKEAETDFYKSDFCITLRKKIESGSNFTSQDWDTLEQELKSVYPDFSTALYQLPSLSRLEYHVCLLTKIRCTPTEIAGVLKKEPSSISSLRGRLYHKVFGRGGGAKEWDNFILGL